MGLHEDCSEDGSQVAGDIEMSHPQGGEEGGVDTHTHADRQNLADTSANIISSPSPVGVGEGVGCGGADGRVDTSHHMGFSSSPPKLEVVPALGVEEGGKQNGVGGLVKSNERSFRRNQGGGEDGGSQKHKLSFTRCNVIACRCACVCVCACACA